MPLTMPDIEQRTRVYPSGVPGLVIHRFLNWRTGKPMKRGWAITHEPSGRRIHGPPFPSRVMAKTAAQVLSGLVDWEQSCVLLNNFDTHKRTMAVLKQFL